MTRTSTDEGRQQMLDRADTDPRERALEMGVVLRGVQHVTDDEVVTDDQTMIINMGPQHPSTHGVLRLQLELAGETVLRSKSIIGYLHTGMEKTAEDLTYMQG